MEKLSKYQKNKMESCHHSSWVDAGSSWGDVGASWAGKGASYCYSRYSWVSFMLNICKEITPYLQFMVLFVGIVHIFMFSVIL